MRDLVQSKKNTDWSARNFRLYDANDFIFTPQLNTVFYKHKDYKHIEAEIWLNIFVYF